MVGRTLRRGACRTIAGPRPAGAEGQREGQRASRSRLTEAAGCGKLRDMTEIIADMPETLVRELRTLNDLELGALMASMGVDPLMRAEEQI